MAESFRIVGRERCEKFQPRPKPASRSSSRSWKRLAPHYRPSRLRFSNSREVGPGNTSETIARQLLVAKKRAFELSRLLRAKMLFKRFRGAITDPERVAITLLDEDFGFALSTALFATKSDRAGTNILEITTCGSMAPYNNVLGGKLVALLLLSPEVADDYLQRYGDRASIISSQMKDEERKKDCTLAWLNTTSLYSLGSSQYEPVRLDEGVISPDQKKISFAHIGDTGIRHRPVFRSNRPGGSECIGGALPVPRS